MEFLVLHHRYRVRGPQSQQPRECAQFAAVGAQRGNGTLLPLTITSALYPTLTESVLWDYRTIHSFARILSSSWEIQYARYSARIGHRIILARHSRPF